MPELPEVETTVRGLERVLDGRKLSRVEVRRPDLRRAFPHDLGQRLTGARVTSLGRRAKFGLIGTDRGDTLIFHLGMSGHWRIDPPERDVHDHLLVETDDGTRLALNDARRFGSVDLVATNVLVDWPALAALGPDALDPTDGGWFKRRFKGRRGPVKPLLLDQRTIAGLGNIYACEALHRAGIHPARAAGAISVPRLDRLAAAIPEVLGEAVAAGGSSLRDFVSPDGTLGFFSKSFAVYGRQGSACACGGKVKRIVQGGRSTFYCPRCQR
ncbi:MAG: bifunctional DNA-formamidopyrimidine glycosylase/DNA-(apurinic or apyrimidinic site) lyase [Sphingomonas sp.]|nr:bifunctional DNA-formamidopyrimidine glycosylase/DNA-(apurinic or apyrimidinic site) lyase [Sphingomonas sp.]